MGANTICFASSEYFLWRRRIGDYKHIRWVWMVEWMCANKEPNETKESITELIVGVQPLENANYFLELALHFPFQLTLWPINSMVAEVQILFPGYCVAQSLQNIMASFWASAVILWLLEIQCSRNFNWAFTLIAPLRWVIPQEGIILYSLDSRWIIGRPNARLPGRLAIITGDGWRIRFRSAFRRWM